MLKLVLVLALLTIGSCTQQGPTLKNYSKIKHINNFINAYPSKSDLDNYGTEGYWATPEEFFAKGSGDCEDYATAKAKLIVDKKLADKKDVKIVVVQTPDAVHAILYVDGYYLDNLYDSIYPSLQPLYKPIMTIDYDLAIQGQKGIDEYFKDK
jgi:predicted transglutaminase-like cysteine proteinase